MANMKLYGLTITEGSSEIHHYMPVYRISDEVIGLYDTVDKVFLVNQGTGAFQKGDDVVMDFVTPSTKVITNNDHTLYAIWEEE